MAKTERIFTRSAWQNFITNKRKTVERIATFRTNRISEIQEIFRIYRNLNFCSLEEEKNSKRSFSWATQI